MNTILARALLFTGVCALPAFAGNQVLLRNLNAADGTPLLLAAGSSGQLYVVSTLSTGGARVVQLDLNGVRQASLDLAYAVPRAAITDPQGNLIVVGFNPADQGSVWKIDPHLASATSLISLPAGINAMAADASGNLYLTGVTSSTSFPVTTGAYQTTPPDGGPYGAPGYAFMTEISPTGKLLYSTYFGSDGADCVGGSYCIGKYGVTDGTAIAVDSSGAVIIAGTTTANGLPTTPGVLGPTCVCGYNVDLGMAISGFIARLQPGASKQLVWSTFLNATYSLIETFSLNGMALDSAGNVIVAGTAPAGLPTTGGHTAQAASGAYLLKLNSSAMAELWGTYFFGDPGAVQAVYEDSQQRITYSGFLGNSTFVARATSDGGIMTDYYGSGPATFDQVGPALVNTSNGGFASVTYTGALWIETTASGPSLLNVSNSASGAYASSLSGLELITLYGIGFGPQTPLYGQVQGGAYTTSQGGYQVLFNGMAAPLLYVQSGQINAIVPGAIGQPAAIQIVTPGGTITGPTAALSAIPVTGVFQNYATGLAAALNQDSSVNSPSNPAVAGSIVSAFVDSATGNYFSDGKIIPLDVFDANISVWVADSDRSLEVVWAGNAPGLVNGVMQINFRLPDPLPSTGGTFPFSVIVGGGAAAQGQIAVAQ